MLEKRRNPGRRALLLTGAVVTAASVVSACARNPVTGERELSLISESQEIEMGREADQQVVAALGLYGGDEVQSYVQRLGDQLAQHSERPELPWTFRVVDDASINAFALPGGYIYVTRGIMAHLNSEAELVGILGHEIGHVTARHAVRRISNQQLTQLGVGLGMILVPELQAFGDVANVGLQLLFLSHSRDDERQSDELGFRYMVEAGYDPREMADVFQMLERASEASGQGQVPGWLATHPDPGERGTSIAEMVEQARVDLAGLAVRGPEYVGRLDGFVWGDNPREGFFQENAFRHPELEFRIHFPRGWQGINSRTAVQVISPQEDAVMVLRLAEQNTPGAALQAFANQQGVQVGQTSTARVSGQPAASGEFQVRTQQGTLQGLVSMIEFQGRVYHIMGYSAAQRWGAHAQTVSSSIATFERETDPAVLGAQPKRVDIVNLDRSMDLETFLQRYPSTVEPEVVARINQVVPGGTLPAGPAKRVVGEGAPSR